MKYKTLFRVLLKLLGVYFAGMGLVLLASQVGNFVSMVMFRRGQFAQPYQNWPYYLQLVSPLVQLGLGTYLFFGGKWIVDRAIPGNRPYCHECGYDLTGAAGDVCNECGTAFRAATADKIYHE